MERPDCVRNLSEIAPQPYERKGISSISRDLEAAVGTRLLGVDLTEIPPGQKSSHFHAHKHKEEFFYVISGRCRLRLGEGSYELAPGDAVSRLQGPAFAISSRILRGAVLGADVQGDGGKA